MPDSAYFMQEVTKDHVGIAIMQAWAHAVLGNHSGFGEAIACPAAETTTRRMQRGGENALSWMSNLCFFVKHRASGLSLLGQHATQLCH